MVATAVSSLSNIIQKVRYLTASPDEASLPTSDIEQRINTFYEQDFPYAIKIDQTREVVSIFTEPNIDTYAVDVDKYQGIRAPVYVEGVQGWLYKDRNAFYSVYPTLSQQYTPDAGDGTTTNFTFTISGPFLPNNVVIGTEAGGSRVAITDDGAGGFVLANTTTTVVGSVDYVSGAFNITFPTAPDDGANITVWVALYSASRPYSILFWKDTITVRPVPDNIYRITYEAYQTPAQLLASDQSPALKQWWQYLAFGVSCEILRDRQDMEGLANVMEGFKRQEQLVLERQATEEIGQANATIYNSTGNINSNYIGWW